MKYALGEIILVMVGILLALQVSNWNQDRKDRISERKLLDNIHRDFVANKALWDTTKVIHFRSQAALDSMVSLFPLGDDTVKLNAFSTQERQIKSHTYNPYSSMVETVISSNSLELIQDEELQEYLMSWKDVLLDYQEEENAYLKMMNDHFHPLMLETFDYTGRDKAMNRAGRSSVKYQNAQINRLGYYWGIIIAIKEEPIENHINEIIRLTEPTKNNDQIL